MPPSQEQTNLVRLVRGTRGAVRMRMELIIRFDYGSIVPWVTSVDGGIHAIAGPDALVLETPVKLRGEDFTTVAEFTVAAAKKCHLFSPGILPTNPRRHELILRKQSSKRLDGGAIGHRGVLTTAPGAKP